MEAKVSWARILAFDLILNEELSKAKHKLESELDFKSKVQKGPVQMGLIPTPAQGKVEIWVPESTGILLGKLSIICKEENIECNVSILNNYVDSIQLEVYNSAFLPLPVIVAKANLKERMPGQAVKREGLLHVALVLRVLIRELGGLSSRVLTFFPTTPLLIEIGVRTDEDTLREIMEKDRSLHKLIERRSFKGFEEYVRLSEEARLMEPFDLSEPTGDIHSHIIRASNVMHIVGHVDQRAWGGLRTPYLITLSHDAQLLDTTSPLKKSSELLIPPSSLSTLLWLGGYVLIQMICLRTWFDYLTAESARIEDRLVRLRKDLTSYKDLENTREELSKIGATLASLLGELDRIGRVNEEGLKSLSGRPDPMSLEIPILPKDTLGLSLCMSYISELGGKGGYFDTLAREVIRSLTLTTSTLRGLEQRVSQLQRYISDLVSFETVRVNRKFSTRIARLTWVLIILTALLFLDRLLPRLLAYFG